MQIGRATQRNDGRCAPPMHDESYDGLGFQLDSLYQRLIRLESAPAFSLALREVLRLLVRVTHCELVCVEIGEYWVGHATYALPPGALRGRLSREQLERTMRERTTITAKVPGAAARWREGSVVLCTPIGMVVPVGVLYAESATALTSVDKARIESVAYHLAAVYPVVQSRAPLADQLHALKQRRVREALDRHDGNIVLAARALSASRTLVYRTLTLNLGVAAQDTEAGHLSSDETDPPDMERGEPQIVSNGSPR
jgi:hypothetical protein